MPAEHFGLLSLLPAVVALGLAIYSKRVIESLLLGIFTGVFMLLWQAEGFVAALLRSVPELFATIAGRHPDALRGTPGIGLIKEASRAELVLIVLLLGAFITVLERSGGAFAFGAWLSRKVRGRRGAQNATALMGCCLFTSAYFSSLATGTVFKPIFDRLKISREKLAFLLDSTSAPINTLIPISGWVAFMSLLLKDNVPGLQDGVKGLLYTVPFNFYCWVLLLMVFAFANGWIRDYGPMRRAEERAARGEGPGEASTMEGAEGDGAPKKVLEGTVADMVVPLGVSVFLLVFLGLWNYTLANPALGLGIGKIPISPNQMLIVSFVMGIVVAGIRYVSTGLMSFTGFLDEVIEGSKSVVIGAMIIILAVTLGDVLRTPAPVGLGAGLYLREIAASLIPPSIVPLAAFLLSSFMGFSLGTAFGVWAVMIPLAIPLGGNPYLVAAAVLSGGTFGDHCSPISDTTIMSSIGAGCEHMEHVNTQLPYAMTAAGIAALLYLVVGFLL